MKQSFLLPTMGASTQMFMSPVLSAVTAQKGYLITETIPIGCTNASAILIAI